MEDMVLKALKNRQKILEQLGFEKTGDVAPINEKQKEEIKNKLGDRFKDTLKLL